MSLPEWFVVETLRSNNEWGWFSEIIVGREKAEAHLPKVQEYAEEIKHGKDKVRLHQLTEDEMKEVIVNRLTKDDFTVVRRYLVEKLGYNELLALLEEMRHETQHRQSV